MEIMISAVVTFIAMILFIQNRRLLADISALERSVTRLQEELDGKDTLPELTPVDLESFTIE
jgi:hypothetical protein